MRQIIRILLATFFMSFCSLSLYSQIVFENGYFIDNSGNKIECLIKNSDWKNNPRDFEYKLSETDEIKLGDPGSIEEFGIYGTEHKYYKFSVNIDKTSDAINSLTEDKNPNFVTEELFLKPIVEGNASLFIYTHRGLLRLFFRMGNGTVEPLVYKRYKLANNTIGKNNQYRIQLWNNLKCNEITLPQIENTIYSAKALRVLFVKYNQCVDPEFIVSEITSDEFQFNINVRPGFNNSSLTVASEVNNSPIDIDFGGNSNFRIGIEFELVLQFNRNKWSVIFEPTFQKYEGENTYTHRYNIIQSTNVNAIVKYQSIEVPLGLRHYLFLNDKNRIFINLSYSFDFGINSILDFESDDGFYNISVQEDLKLKSKGNFVFGFGYNYNGRFGMEFRLGSRGVLNSDPNWISDYKFKSFIIGYKIF